MTTTVEHDVTTIRLPHTGLHVPDATLSVAAYRQHQTRDGVAFTASLRVGNKKVGLIENDGHGGETGFFPGRPAEYGYLEIGEYAALCRTEEGETVTVEDLLNELIEEQQAAKWVTKNTGQGQVVLRQMDYVLVGDDDVPVAGFPPRPTQMVTARQPQTEAHTRELAKQILTKYETSKYAWWQMWNGGGWHDITPRPADISKDLYA